MAKLNQIIAVSNGKKSRVQSAITGLYHQLQKDVLFSGISRTYRPKDDDGEQLPLESNRVQYRVARLIESASDNWSSLFDAVATQDQANRHACADVTVDEIVILPNVPVTHLLFLEKQLNDIHSFVSKVPTLDPAFIWTWSTEADCYATIATETTRTKKVPKSFVRAEATKEHPAQVDVFHEDVLVGYWKKIDFSGAIPEEEKRAYLERIVSLQDAVKAAREKANSCEVVQVTTGKPVMDYIFGNTAS